MDKRACSILAIILSISVAWVGGDAHVTVVPLLTPPLLVPMPLRPPPPAVDVRPAPRRNSVLCSKWLWSAAEPSDDIRVRCVWDVAAAAADDDDDVGSRPGRDFSAADSSSCSSSQRTVSRAAYR